MVDEKAELERIGIEVGKRLLSGLEPDEILQEYPWLDKVLFRAGPAALGVTLLKGDLCFDLRIAASELGRRPMGTIKAIDHEKGTITVDVGGGQLSRRSDRVTSADGREWVPAEDVKRDREADEQHIHRLLTFIETMRGELKAKDAELIETKRLLAESHARLTEVADVYAGRGLAHSMPEEPPLRPRVQVRCDHGWDD